MPTPFIVTTNEIAFEAVEFQADEVRKLEEAIGNGNTLTMRDANGATAHVIFNPDHVKYVAVEVDA